MRRDPSAPAVAAIDLDGCAASAARAPGHPAPRRANRHQRGLVTRSTSRSQCVSALRALRRLPPCPPCLVPKAAATTRLRRGTVACKITYPHPTHRHKLHGHSYRTPTQGGLTLPPTNPLHDGVVATCCSRSGAEVGSTVQASDACAPTLSSARAAASFGSVDTSMPQNTPS